MITEIAQIDIKPGMEQEFEAGVAQATPVFRRAKGCHGLRWRNRSRSRAATGCSSNGTRWRTIPSAFAAARISRSGANASAIASRARRRSSTPSRSTRASERMRLALAVRARAARRRAGVRADPEIRRLDRGLRQPAQLRRLFVEPRQLQRLSAHPARRHAERRRHADARDLAATSRSRFQARGRRSEPGLFRARRHRGPAGRR